MSIPEFLCDGRKCWKLDSGRWTLDARILALHPGRWTMDSELWTLDTER